MEGIYKNCKDLQGAHYLLTKMLLNPAKDVRKPFKTL